MYNDILSALSCIFNDSGTIFAVLCVIKMSFKDVMQTKTVENFDHSEQAVFEQRYYARAGIGVIFIGAILQLICIFYKNIPPLSCGIVSVFSIFIAIMFIVIERRRMKKDQDTALKQD